MKSIKSTALAIAAGLVLSTSSLALNANAADDTIKVGILHSLSGTMAISETTLKDAKRKIVIGSYYCHIPLNEEGAKAVADAQREARSAALVNIVDLY